MYLNEVKFDKLKLQLILNLNFELQTINSLNYTMLSTADIVKKVKELEIISKRITTHLFTGEYHSAFKGRE